MRVNELDLTLLNGDRTGSILVNPLTMYRATLAVEAEQWLILDPQEMGLGGKPALVLYHPQSDPPGTYSTSRRAKEE